MRRWGGVVATLLFDFCPAGNFKWKMVAKDRNEGYNAMSFRIEIEEEEKRGWMGCDGKNKT